MVDEQKMKEGAKRSGKEIEASQVIWFGSYARGKAGENSDVDFMVVAESELPRDPSQ